MRAEIVAPESRTVDQHTGTVLTGEGLRAANDLLETVARIQQAELDPTIGSTLPENEQSQFRARVAASRSVMAWLDLDPGRGLIGCTPAMISQVAVDAYCRMGGGSADDLAGVRAELDNVMFEFRRLGESIAGLTSLTNSYHSERDDAIESRDQYRDERDEARTRVGELEAELRELRGES